MTKEKDISGQRFGRLVAIKKDHCIWDKETRRSENYWLFKCDCGKEKVINKYSVLSGKTSSCGCLNIEKTKDRNLKHGLFKTEKRLYRCWQDMKNRCYNKKRKKYKNYGERGIIVCDEWKNNFEAFFKWSKENNYSDDLTLDRIDVNGNYEPQNCRWATPKEQANNTRKNHKITLNGITKNLCEWLKIYNIYSGSYWRWRKKGFSNEQIFLGER